MELRDHIIDDVYNHVLERPVTPLWFANLLRFPLHEGRCINPSRIRSACAGLSVISVSIPCRMANRVTRGEFTVHRRTAMLWRRQREMNPGTNVLA